MGIISQWPKWLLTLNSKQPPFTYPAGIMKEYLDTRAAAQQPTKFETCHYRTFLGLLTRCCRFILFVVVLCWVWLSCFSPFRMMNRKQGKLLKLSSFQFFVFVFLKPLFTWVFIHIFLPLFYLSFHPWGGELVRTMKSDLMPPSSSFLEEVFCFFFLSLGTPPLYYSPTTFFFFFLRRASLSQWEKVLS